MRKSIELNHPKSYLRRSDIASGNLILVSVTNIVLIEDAACMERNQADAVTWRVKRVGQFVSEVDNSSSKAIPLKYFDFVDNHSNTRHRRYRVGFQSGMVKRINIIKCHRDSHYG